MEGLQVAKNDDRIGVERNVTEVHFASGGGTGKIGLATQK